MTLEKGQSKFRSLMEANTNTLVGLLLTFVFSPLFYWLVGMEYTIKQLGVVTLLFTVLSVIRGYVIRRFFNKKEKQKDQLLLDEVNYWKEISKDVIKREGLVAKTSSKWENLYRTSRGDRARLNNELYTLSDKLAELQDEYDYTVVVAKEYINEKDNQVLVLNKVIDKFREELDMCKHLHRAAVSDLVEGADYNGEDSNKSTIEDESN